MIFEPIVSTFSTFISEGTKRIVQVQNKVGGLFKTGKKFTDDIVGSATNTINDVVGVKTRATQKIAGFLDNQGINGKNLRNAAKAAAVVGGAAGVTASTALGLAALALESIGQSEKVNETVRTPTTQAPTEVAQVQAKETPKEEVVPAQAEKTPKAETEPETLLNTIETAKNAFKSIYNKL